MNGKDRVEVENEKQSARDESRRHDAGEKLWNENGDEGQRIDKDGTAIGRENRDGESSSGSNGEESKLANDGIHLCYFTIFLFFY